MLGLLTREHCTNLRFPQLYGPDLLEGMRCLLPHAVVEARQLRGEILIDTQLHCQLSLLASNLLLQGTSVVGQARDSCQKAVRSDEGVAICIYAHAHELQCQHAEVCRRRFDPDAVVIHQPYAQRPTNTDRCRGRLEEGQVRDGGDVRPVLPAVRVRAAVSHFLERVDTGIDSATRRRCAQLRVFLAILPGEKYCLKRAESPLVDKDASSYLHLFGIRRNLTR